MKPTSPTAPPSAGPSVPARRPYGELLRRPDVLSVATLLAGLILATYANSFDAGLVLDNYSIITQDPRLQSTTWSNVDLIFRRSYWWPTTESNLFRPLVTLSYLINYSLVGNGANPFGYHVVNLALHWVNSLLVFGLLAVVVERRWPAILAAAVFAVHPVQVESVTNIIARADLFVACAILSILHLHRLSLTAARRAAVFYRVAMAVLTLLGVFCKESAVVVIALVPVYDLALAERAAGQSWWQSVREQVVKRGAVWSYVAVIPGVVALLVVRRIMFADTPVFDEIGADNPLVVLGPVARRLTACRVLLEYVRLLVWPVRLSCDYSYHQIPLYGYPPSQWTDDVWCWVGVGFLLTYVAVLAWTWRRQSAVCFFLSFAAITFLPTSNLLISVGSILGERFLYLPMVGVAGCLAFVGPACVRVMISAWPISVGRRRRVVGALVGTALLALAGRTWLRNRDWRDNASLWSSAIAACPDSFKGYKGYAEALSRADPQHQRIDATIAMAERARAVLEAQPLPPEHMPNGVYQDLGTYYLAQGDTRQHAHDPTLARVAPEATSAYRQAVAVLERGRELDLGVNAASRRARLQRGIAAEWIDDVGNLRLHETLGIAYFRLNDYDRAQATFEYVLRLDPLRTDAYLALASAEFQLGRRDDGIVRLIQTLLLRSDHPDVWRQLQELSAGAPAGESLTRLLPGGRLGLNDLLPQMRQLIDRALLEMTALLLDTKRYRQALDVRELAVTKHGARAEMFAELEPRLETAKRLMAER